MRTTPMTRSTPPVSNAIISATVTMKKKLDSTSSTALNAPPMTATRLLGSTDLPIELAWSVVTPRDDSHVVSWSVYLANSSLYCGNSSARRPAETTRASETETRSR